MINYQRLSSKDMREKQSENLKRKLTKKCLKKIIRTNENRAIAFYSAII